MKKTYDLIMNSNGRIKPMTTGMFERSHKMVYGDDVPFPSEKYTIVELPMCNYRVRNDDIARKDFALFIEKARKHQEGN